MSSAPPPQADERQIDWVRAAFMGSVAGGILWSVILRVSALLDKGLTMDVRLACSIAAVCLPVVLVGFVSYRRAQRSATRTYAVASLIAPCTGAVVFILAFATGLPGLLTSR
jgi:hypothetical protein